MKKKIFLFVAAVAMLASCQTDDDLLTTRQDGKATGFVITADDNISTRYDISETDGEILLNENLFRTIDLYFFKRTSDEQSAPAADAQAAYHMSIDLTEESVQRQYDVECNFSKDVVKRIFGDELSNGTTCFVMAVVNKPANMVIAENTTRLEIFSKLVESTSFATDVPHAPEDDPETTDVDESLNFLNTFGVQDCFVMLTDNAVATLAKTGDKYSITGTAQVWRMASKFDLQVTQVSDTVTDAGGNLWRSFPEYMQVQFNNGVKKATMETDFVPYIDQTNPTDSLPYEADYFDAKYRPFRLLEGVYEHHVPFYSYTNNWRKTTRRENYYSLMLPWRMLKADVAAAIKDETRTLASLTEADFQGARVNTYYQVPITTDADKRLKRNTYYISRLRVGVMGSFTVAEPVTITSSYIILPWGSASIKADMAEIAYLTVQYNTDTLNNINSHGVQYASSHPVTATVTKVEYYDYSQPQIRKITIERIVATNGTVSYRTTTLNTVTNQSTSTTSNTNPFTAYTAEAVDGQIVLTHEIPSDMYSEQNITVEVSNGKVANETIVFTQYPPIYIGGHQSTGYVYVNEYSYNYTKANGNNRNHRAYDDRSSSLGNINSNAGTLSGAGDNENPNLYTITITSFTDDQYQIGDPRSKTPDNLNAGNTVTLNRLTNYYPTSSTVSENVISPQFQIASSYGVINSTYYLTYDQAKRRCASYQEDGYPAGRWRMPTYAEVRFIMSLSQEGKIPSLFNFFPNWQGNDTEGYWVANGKIVMLNNQLQFSTNYNNSETAVRCVYDTWYWGKTHATGNNANTKLWGDATNFSWNNYTHSDD